MSIRSLTPNNISHEMTYILTLLLVLFTVPAQAAVCTGQAVEATCFGVVANGTTDDTAAWNAAIAFANSQPNTTIIAPANNSLISSLNPLTAGGRIVCATGRGSCTITHSSSPAISWHGGNGGGMSGMRLNATGSCLITLDIRHGAFMSVFEDMFVGTGIGTLARLGQNAVGDQAGTSLWKGLVTPAGAGTGPCPLFDLVNGYGFSLMNSVLYLNGPTTVGRNIINANLVGPINSLIGSFDAVNIQNNTLGPSYEFFHSEMVGNSAVEDVTIQNNYIINCQNSCINITGAGFFGDWSISNNWIDGNGTSRACVNIAPMSVFTAQFVNNRVLACANDGVVIGGGQVKEVQILGNNLFQLNQSGTGGYGITVSGDIRNGLMGQIKIKNNRVSDFFALNPGHLATIGILVRSVTTGGVMSWFEMTGNDAAGSTRYVWPASQTQGIVKDNIGQ